MKRKTVRSLVRVWKATALGTVILLLVFFWAARSLEDEPPLHALKRILTSQRNWLPAYLLAHSGNAAAQFDLGMMYKLGIVHGSVPQNHPKALKWFRKSADQGYLAAQYNLAELYLSAGENKDYPEATKWLRMAANQGDPYAPFKLGEIYRKGQGTRQDYAEAYKWYYLAE